MSSSSSSSSTSSSQKDPSTSKKTLSSQYLQRRPGTPLPPSDGNHLQGKTYSKNYPKQNAIRNKKCHDSESSIQLQQEESFIHKSILSNSNISRAADDIATKGGVVDDMPIHWDHSQEDMESEVVQDLAAVGALGLGTHRDVTNVTLAPPPRRRDVAQKEHYHPLYRSQEDDSNTDELSSMSASYLKVPKSTIFREPGRNSSMLKHLKKSGRSTPVPAGNASGNRAPSRSGLSLMGGTRNPSKTNHSNPISRFVGNTFHRIQQVATEVTMMLVGWIMSFLPSWSKKSNKKLHGPNRSRKQPREESV